MAGFLSMLFGGNKSEKDVKVITPYVAKINAFFEQYQSISNDELRSKTNDFRSRIKEYLKDIPTLYIMVSNPKKYGLIGNNIAGITLNIPVETQFKTYKTLVPGLKSVGVIYDANNSGEIIREAGAVAKKLGVQLVAVSVTSQKEVPEALRSMLGKVDAVWMVPDETVVTTDSFKYFLVTTLEKGVPFFAASDIFVEAGALAALTPDYTDVGRQGCQLAIGFTDGQVSLAETGARPPRKINLSLNLKTARKIGLAIPKSVIESAKLVYQ